MVHSHGAPSAGLGPSRRVRATIVAVLVPLVLATIAGLIVLWPSGDTPRIVSAERVDATILDIQPCGVLAGGALPPPAGDTGTDDEAGTDDPDPECREALVRVDAGPDSGTDVVVPMPFGTGAPEFAPGDEVVLAAAADASVDARYELVDFQRSRPLFILAAAFAVAVVLLSRWRGLAALAGLGLSVLVLGYFVLPALLVGSSPLAVAVVGAAAIMIGTLYLAHGVSVRTSIALIGTLFSLTLTGLLGYVFTELGRFTGLADSEAAYLGAIGEGVDVRGLLLAGLVIGALGVLDDVTVTQSAVVWELAAADPESSRRSLLAAGLRVGRSHVAATVNTLVLAYAGASLPLLMIFVVADRGVTDIVTTELVAQELVRAMVGSLGIVAAVPVTTALAALAVRASPSRPRGRRVSSREPVGRT